jgi:hypothetical protein
MSVHVSDDEGNIDKGCKESDKFYAHGSVHCESTLKCSNKMTLFVQYFIPCKQLYMFRVKHVFVGVSFTFYLCTVDICKNIFVDCMSLP